MSQSTPSGYKIWEPLLLAIVAVVGMVAGSKMTLRTESISDKAGGSGQISEIVRFIEEQYVDEIDSGELMEKAVRSVLEELDPHSGYISPEEVREINEKMNSRNSLAVKRSSKSLEFIINNRLSIFAIPEAL